MHLLVLTLYYAPDRTGIAPLTAELCEYLAARGHRVSVLTGFPHYPQWRVPEQYRGKLWTREALNGVSVYRGYIYVPSRRTAFRRIAYDTSVAVSASLWGLFVRDIDLVMAISTPLQLGVAGDFISRLRDVPFVFCIQDLVPAGGNVFIKPNLTYPRHKEGVTTSPAMLETLVRCLKDRSARITIVESDGAYNLWKAEQAFAGHGLYELVKVS